MTEITAPASATRGLKAWEHEYSRVEGRHPDARGFVVMDEWTRQAHGCDLRIVASNMWTDGPLEFSWSAADLRPESPGEDGGSGLAYFRTAERQAMTAARKLKHTSQARGAAIAAAEAER